MKKVLILGGYGNFGARISTALVKAKIPIIIAGRDTNKANELLQKITLQYPEAQIETIQLDTNNSISTSLEKSNPAIVINTVGPFQSSNYSVATSCIQHNIHYIDLADGRDFVTGITSLDQQAKANNVMVISGASTLPGLSSAVIAHFKHQFSVIDSVIYGIAPGQKTTRGIATTKSILSYLGRPIKPYKGCQKTLYGWQDLYCQEYPEIGKRWMANCDIPDFDLFPAKFQIKSLHFSAGMESTLLHFSMWAISYLVRIGLPLNLERHAEFLLRISNLFDRFGTENGGMHIIIKGKDFQGNLHEIKWFLLAFNSDGPQVPCIPAIILTKKLFAGQINITGALPCVECVTLDEYMSELNGFAIKQIVN